MHNDSRLQPKYREVIQAAPNASIGVSIISCWELAKLVENRKLALAVPAREWINKGLSHSKIKLIPLTPNVVVEATQLPGAFHRDPADQLIVATSRIFGYPLLTVDSKIVSYPHVALLRV